MFCPRCGLQTSDEIRYCPKCGLSLTPHAAILTGYESAAPAPFTGPPPAAKGGRAVNRGAAKLMFFAAALSPVSLLLSIAADHPVPLLLSFLMFLAGVIWWLYVRLFGEDLPQPARHAPPRDLKAGAGAPALGPPQFVPASSFNRHPANTAEMAQPPSVTENTTTLLDRGE